MSVLRILHIDGNRPFAESFQRHMRSLAATSDATMLFDTADIYSEALNMLKVREYDVVVAEGSFIGGSVLDLLSERFIHVPPVIVVAHKGSEQLARDTLKGGAYDYFSASGDVHVYKLICESILSAVGTVASEDTAVTKEEVLSKTAGDFLTLSEGASLYGLLSSHLVRIWPGGCTILFSKDPLSGTFVLEEARGPKKALRSLESVFGAALRGSECCIDTSLVPSSEQGTLVPVKGNISSLFCGMVPEEILFTLTEELGLSDIHAYLFECGGILRGLALFLHIRGSSLLDVEVTEAYLRQATLAFRRLCLEQELIAQRNELSTYAHTLSHEIRNDLSIIKGYAELAVDKDNNEVCRKAIDRIDRLAAFVERGVSLADAGTILGEPEHVDMGALFSEVAALVLPNNIAYEQTELPPAMADRQRMGQVARNLLQNIVDHAGATSVKVSGSCGGGLCQYSVTDNGHGIKGDVPMIFEWGYTTSTTGSGLGMPLVARIVRAMGGTIHVAETSELGTRIVFAIPSSGMAPTPI